jgi:hypothetical protein
MNLALSASVSLFACVDFPHRSSPSSTIKAPRDFFELTAMASLVTAAIEVNENNLDDKTTMDKGMWLMIIVFRLFYLQLGDERGWDEGRRTSTFIV